MAYLKSTRNEQYMRKDHVFHVFMCKHLFYRNESQRDQCSSLGRFHFSMRISNLSPVRALIAAVMLNSVTTDCDPRESLNWTSITFSSPASRRKQIRLSMACQSKISGLDKSMQRTRWPKLGKSTGASEEGVRD